MFKPPYLNKGDNIALVTPAEFCSETEINNASKVIKEWGFTPILSKTIHCRYGRFAGDEETRYKELQRLLDSDKIAAIYCIKGGYGMLNITEHLDFSLLQATPKWLIGSGSISILHSLFNKLGIETIYAPLAADLINIPKEHSNLIKNLLCGEQNNYTIRKTSIDQQGIADGELIGGNLKLLHHLLPGYIKGRIKSNILYIDIDDNDVYETEFLLSSLHHLKKIQSFQGVIIGGNIKKNEIINSKYILKKVFENYTYPVSYGLLGKNKNLPLVLGTELHLEIQDNITYISTNTFNYKMPNIDELHF